MVIAAFPATICSWAWYSSSELMSLFQHLCCCISWSRDHQAACFGSVNLAFPVVASSTSLMDEMPCAPMVEYSQPPNQPSLMPAAMGVMPLALSASQALSSCAHVFGGDTPAFRSTSLR